MFKKYYHIIFLFFISSWIFFYQKDGIISLGDFVFPVSPEVSLYSRFFSWKEFFSLGNSSTVDFVNIVHYLPIFTLNKIEFSINFVQSLFYIFLFFTASYSIYLLLSELLGNFKYKKLAAIVAANFYIFNPYMFTTKLMGYTMSLYAYIFAPLILYLFYKYLKIGNYFRNKYIYLIGIFFLLSAPASTQPAYTLYIVLVLIYYVLFLFIFKRLNNIILYKSSIVALIFILINSFWIIPSLGSGLFSDILSKTKSVTNLDVLQTTSGQSLVEVFRFLGMFGFSSNWRGVPYFPYNQTYYTPIFIIISFALLFITLSFCLFKKTRDSHDEFWGKYFFSMFLVTIFFIGGTFFLFPEIKLWLYDKFSVLLMYRKPYEKMGFFLIFSFAGLLAFSLKYIINWVESRSIKYKNAIITGFLIFVLFLVNIYSFPFWTKQVFNPSDQRECTVSSINYYPDYYYKFGEYSKSNKKIGKIIGLPVNHTPISSGVEAYTWGHIGSDPVYSFINTGYILLNPKIPFLNNYYERIDSGAVNQDIYKNNLDNINGLFNVKNNVLRNDVCWQLYGSPNPEQDKKYLENNFNKIISFGELDIFNVSHDNFSPIFFTPLKINVTNDTINNLSKIISQPDYKIRSAIYFKEQNKKIAKEVLDSFGQNNLRKVIGAETKTDKIEKIDEEIIKIKDAITNLEAEGLNKLSKKEKIQLENLQEQEKILEQKKTELQIDPAQFFAEVENADNYNLSFQLASCQEKVQPLLNNIPLITINDKSYNIPYKIIKVKENNKNINRYKIKTDNDCFVKIEGVELNQGEAKIVTNYIIGLDNMVFSKDFPKEVKTPVLEFKKVNPTKYIVRVHGAQSNFPLVFSESFHNGWKAYLTASEMDSRLRGNDNRENGNDKMGDYKILDGNEDDQATAEELKSFIDKGYISTLGNLNEKNIKHVKWENNKEVFDYNEKYRIDFISKNFQDTIQNDNLPSGRFYDTWLAKKVGSGNDNGILSLSLQNDNVMELPEENHLMANGYANSWWVDLEGVCKAESGKGSFCVKNADGSYDFEMVIEFWPQRLFYLGLVISGITLLGCLSYLGWDSVKRRKRKDIEAVDDEN